MKHRIVAVSPQGKEYFGEFEEGMDPDAECEEFLSEFAKSDFVNYKLILASGDTLFIPNLKEWHIVIEAEKDVKDVEKRCKTCNFGDVPGYEQPCRDCVRAGGYKDNWQPK